MKRLEVMGVMICFLFISVACSAGSNTKKEYDQLLAEKNELQTQYDELNNAFDQLDTSNQILKDKIKELKAMMPDDQIFNIDVYNALTSENYNKDDLQDQRLWGTYSVDNDKAELYLLYSSGLYVDLYMTTDSDGQYFLTYGSYSYDQNNDKLAIKDHSSDNAKLFSVTFFDNGMSLRSISDDYQHDEVWTIIK